MKWDRGPLAGKQVFQALDIHFPLAALSLRKKPPVRKLCLIQPHEPSLCDNDTVTVKVLFHKTHPDEPSFSSFLKHKGIVPAFWSELPCKKYLTVAFQYSKQLPLTVTRDQEKGHAALLHQYFTKRGMQVGDGVDDLTIQVIQMGSPPAIYEIGRTSARWEERRRFSISTTV